MAWYDKGRKKPSKKIDKSRTVQCVECGKNHIALEGSWVCNGRGEVLCHGEGKCMEVRMLRSRNAQSD